MFGCVPTATEEVLHVAVVPPATACALQLPIVTPSLRKFTVPVGVPAPGAVTATVAVNVTDCPNTLGFGAEPAVVVVAALLTVWLYAGDVEPMKLPSPL
jgi:hypothetical protein